MEMRSSVGRHSRGDCRDQLATRGIQNMERTQVRAYSWHFDVDVEGDVEAETKTHQIIVRQIMASGLGFFLLVGPRLCLSEFYPAEERLTRDHSMQLCLAAEVFVITHTPHDTKDHNTRSLATFW